MLLNLITLALLLLTVGLALVLLTCLAMAKVLLTPERMTGGRALVILRRLSPAEIGLPYEDLSFTVRDDRTNRPLRLTAWWIPAPNPAADRTALIVHGYSDSKIGGIAWAPTFRDLGYHVLAVDLRAHGDSEGDHTTAGYFERHDLSQLIDQLRAARPAQTRELVLFGVSLGAAVVAATADLRAGANVDAVIMDCPYSDYLSAARTHARAQGLPGPLFQNVAIDWARRLSGADFLACAPTRLIPTLPSPLMVIHGQADLFVDPADMRAVEAACRRRPPDQVTEYWEAADTHHVLALRTDPVEFKRRIGSFLAAARAWRAGRPATSHIAPAVPQEVTR